MNHNRTSRIFLSVEAIWRAQDLADCMAFNMETNMTMTYVPPIYLVCAESVSHVLTLTNR